MAIGNNLMVNPPKTTSGLNVVAAARAAAEKTGDAKKSDGKREEKDDKDDAKDNEKQHVASKQDGGNSNKSQRSRRESSGSEEEEKTSTRANSLEQSNKDSLSNEVAAVGDTDNPYVKKLFKDKSETQQVGWLYESLSPNSRNYANVVMPLNTQVQVTVTQDMQTNQWNFAPGKPIGQIVINQNFR
jgi:hypothetical protein